jgi:uncharacterized protein (TIGR02001 family)
MIMSIHRKLGLVLLILICAGLAGSAAAESKIDFNTGVDLYNRYVWRGLDIASTPSVQPTMSIGCPAGFEFGIWGAYTLSNQASESDEIDFWLGYTGELNSGAVISAMVTDYYYPNAGIDFFNFNNYDAVDDDDQPDPGAHIIELGASFSGPESFPVTISGFINVHNDAGNNAYFQLDVPVTLNETDLNLFCGATPGSNDNPDYYGTDEFAFINLGVSAARDIEISDRFSLPLTVSFVLNPKAEISYLLVGMSF